MYICNNIMIMIISYSESHYALTRVTYVCAVGGEFMQPTTNVKLFRPCRINFKKTTIKCNKV